MPKMRDITKAAIYDYLIESSMLREFAVEYLDSHVTDANDFQANEVQYILNELLSDQNNFRRDFKALLDKHIDKPVGLVDPDCKRVKKEVRTMFSTRTMTCDEAIEEIKEVLAQTTGEYIAEIYEKVTGKVMEYKDDCLLVVTEYTEKEVLT